VPSRVSEGDSLGWALQPLEELAAEIGYGLVYQSLEKGHSGVDRWRPLLHRKMVYPFARS